MVRNGTMLEALAWEGQGGGKEQGCGQRNGKSKAGQECKGHRDRRATRGQSKKNMKERPTFWLKRTTQSGVSEEANEWGVAPL